MHFNILRCISFTIFSPTCFGRNSGRLQGDFPTNRIKLMHGTGNILEKKSQFVVISFLLLIETSISLVTFFIPQQKRLWDFIQMVQPSVSACTCILLIYYNVK